jgi:RNA 3'-terminal phosphate cyclase
MTSVTPLRYTGHLHLRTRLVLSILSGKSVGIDGISPNDKNPGLRGMLCWMSICERDDEGLMMVL